MHPTLFPFQTKFSAPDSTGTFTGLASTFGGEPDSYGDVIVPGAFSKSLAEHKVRKSMPSLLWSHSMDEPIGVWTDIRETHKGLEVQGKLTLDVGRAREAYALLKDQALSLSIGFMLPDGGSFTDSTGIRKLKQIDLMEVSLVSIPANRNARVTQVKSQIDDLQGFERQLRDSMGLSARQAKRLCSAGYSAMFRDEPEEEGPSEAEIRALANRIKSINNNLRNYR
jgi:HK97 family phage prohead protease